MIYQDLTEISKNKKVNIGIIGAGISGLSCANILNEKHFKTKIFERKNANGGLISCDLVKNNLFHKVGGHVFNSKNPIISNWFWKYFDKNKEFVLAERNATIYLNKRFIKYPIELNISQIEREYIPKIIGELIELAHKETNQVKQNFDNFKDFLIGNFGETLYEIYFKNYNQKIWNKELKSIPIDWLEGKLPMINPLDILTKNIMISKEDNMVHNKFYYPKKGGSQFIANRLSSGLKINKCEIVDIKLDKNKILINDNFYVDKLIFTGDIRELLKILDKSILDEFYSEIINYKSINLDSNGTTTVLCECDRNEYSWIYLPEKNIKPHRIIMTGNFSSTNNASYLSKDRITCTLECSGKVTLKEIRNNIKKLPFNLVPIKYNFCESSYIIHNKDTRKIIYSLKKKLSKFNIFLCGRFAEWEYYNMDAAIESALKLCDEIEALK